MASGDLPFSQSCENNKAFILPVLQQVFADRSAVLEIASGTGQHACYFADNMPWLQWQPTELAQNLATLRARCTACGGANLVQERALDVRQDTWPPWKTDAVFSANSLHIMAFSAVEKLFAALGKFAGDDVVLAVYGPFNYNGCYTSASNARFDQWLAQRSPDSAIRHFEDVDRLAQRSGFELQGDHAMPANNRLLVWAKTPR